MWGFLRFLRVCTSRLKRSSDSAEISNCLIISFCSRVGCLTRKTLVSAPDFRISITTYRDNRIRVLLSVVLPPFGETLLLKSIIAVIGINANSKLKKINKFDFT